MFTGHIVVSAVASSCSYSSIAFSCNMIQEINDGCCFGFFREHKLQKVPFSLQECLSFTWDFKKPHVSTKLPPKLSLEIVSSSGESFSHYS